MLAASDGPLSTSYDLLILDLDGVVYIGADAVPRAPHHLQRAAHEGARLAFVTNNASRPPEAVAEKLQGLGVPAEVADVVTSAQAAARVLAERFAVGSRVACLGAVGLEEALQAEGLTPTPVDDDEAVALVTGYGPDVVWRDVMRAAVRVRAGLPWVASNSDLSLPTPFGPAPGHGVMVRMLSEFSGVKPDIAGKPARPLLDETVRRVGGRRPLMIGDRLDTDIEGAAAVGMDSLLVLTGVTGLPDLVVTPPAARPTYLAPDLSGLFEVHARPEQTDDGWAAGGWVARVAGDRLEVDGAGAPGDWWRAVAAAAWTHLDRAGEPCDVTETEPPASEDER